MATSTPSSQSGGDQQQQPSSSQFRPLLIVVEGNISAGKTTLCRDLAAALGYEVFLEPTVANPYLERYYKEPKKYALPLQMWMLEHRFRSYLEALKWTWADNSGNCDEAAAASSARPGGILLDRSIFSDWVFAKKNFDDGNISEEGYDEYMAVRKQMLARIPFPDVVINLNVSPDECFRRVHCERQRACESGIPLEYLQGLNDCYNELVVEFTTRGVHVNDIVSDAFVECSVVAAELQKHIATTRSPEFAARQRQRQRQRQQQAEEETGAPTGAPANTMTTIFASTCPESMQRDVLEMIRTRPTFGRAAAVTGAGGLRERAGEQVFDMDMSKIQNAEETLNQSERERRRQQQQQEDEDEVVREQERQQQQQGAVATTTPATANQRASATTKSRRRRTKQGSPTTIVAGIEDLDGSDDNGGDDKTARRLAVGDAEEEEEEDEEAEEDIDYADAAAKAASAASAAAPALPEVVAL